MAHWETVIGLEVHAQLLTESKAFCSAPNRFGEEANSSVGVVSAGLPGSLPVLNEKVVELAVRAGIALDCDIPALSVFSRKNYFYPDLPKGYQITQAESPICLGGQVSFTIPGRPDRKCVHLTRIHIEEDAGKSVHYPGATLVNLNRSGVPLIEIVSEPEIRGPEEAVAYLKQLHSVLVFCGVTDGNMEEGNFRCDVNVSVRRVGVAQLGTRCELKNLNSFRFVEKALEYEIARQIAVLEAGGTVTQETRGWDAAAGKTFLMRSKEDAHDYRYFPEPDLPPLLLHKDWIEKLRQTMPELPDQKRARYIDKFKLSSYDAEVLTSSKDLATYFEQVVSLDVSPKVACNWITTELLGGLHKRQTLISDSPIKPERLCGLIRLLDSDMISGKIAKEVFDLMWDDIRSPEKLVDERGWKQISDETQIRQWISEVLQSHPAEVLEYKSGKKKMFGFFVGELMKLSDGKANPRLVSKVLIQKLEDLGDENV